MMNKIDFKQMIKPFGVLLMAVTLYGCSSEASSPARNKYPEYLNSGGGFEAFQSEDAQAMAQQQGGLLTSNINYQFTGGTRSSIALALPDILEDSLAVKLFQTYRPLAIPLLAQWARMNNNKGLVIDLRSGNGTAVMRTEYMISQKNNFSVPLAFVYDKNSAGRAFGYMNMLKEFPEVESHIISSN